MAMANPPGVPGLLLCDDLIFVSRVAGTARSLGLNIKAAALRGGLAQPGAQHRPPCVIIDLANPGLDLPALLRQLTEICSTLPRVAAYGSHVDTETLRAARDAGCDPVWPRSKFVEELATALPDWFGQAHL